MLLTLPLLTGCSLMDQTVCPGEPRDLHEGRGPSELEYDCRCTFAVNDEPMCQPNADRAKELTGPLGEGFDLTTQGSYVQQRFGEVWPEYGEIILAVSTYTKEPGLLLALDYTTGDRRVLSGTYLDDSVGQVTVGEGQMWGEPNYALRGPDDQIYVYAVSHAHQGQIWRVDPETGDREVVWLHATDGFGQCMNGVPDDDDPNTTPPKELQLQLEGEGFAVSDQGSFYLTTIRNGSPEPGSGVIEVSADGSSCRVVSMGEGEAGNAYADGVGGGYPMGPDVREVAVLDGRLFIHASHSILEVDPETGDRVRLGAAPEGQMQWHDALGMILITGIKDPQDKNIHLFDTETGELWSQVCQNIDEGHPIGAECFTDVVAFGEEQAWVRPDGKLIIATNYDYFVIAEMETGNAHHFSY